MKFDSNEMDVIKEKLISETKKYILLTAYISLVMLGLKIYTKAVLDEHHISYFRISFSLFESMILAKIIMLGEFLNLGERFNNRPLIIKTVYKSFCMSLLAFVFSIVEYAVEGLVNSREFSGIVAEILIKGKGEMLAHSFVMFINFIPLFALWETSQATGQNELFQLLFFRRQMSPTVDKGNSTDSALQ